MMNHADFDDNYRRKLWCKTISTATKLDNLMVRKWDRNFLILNFSTDTPDTEKHLRTFSGIAALASHDRKGTRTKIEERGRTVMFAGYADDHTGDV